MIPKPEPEFAVGMYARRADRPRAAPSSVIVEIVEINGVKKMRLGDEEQFLSSDEIEPSGFFRYRAPEPVLRLFTPSGRAMPTHSNTKPYYGDEFRPEVQLWCVRTLGYTPRLCLEDIWETGEDGAWPEYDTAWFAYFDTETDRIAFVLAFTGAETLDRFKAEDGIA